MMRPIYRKSLCGSAILMTSVVIGFPAAAQETQPPLDEETISTTILEGEPQEVIPAPSARPKIVRGDISLNFPSTDVRVVAQAVLGDVLRVPWTVAPGLSSEVTVVTPNPISRASVLPFLEEALRASDLALIEQNGVFNIAPIDQARSSGAGDGSSEAFGFSSEIMQLQYVNAEEMRRLLEPVLPGVITSADALGNRVVISGTTGQRASARDLLRQFDVNWLRGMTFGLFIPRKTDSRLIVPELEKLLNSPDAPTRNLVRLISMEKLNGILAISQQRHYLDDVGRFIEILDREGQNNEPRLFVYRVQNGRSRDLARTLNQAFGNAVSSGGSDNGNVSRDVQFDQSPDGNGNVDQSRNSGNGNGNGNNNANSNGGGFGGSNSFGGNGQQGARPAPNDGEGTATPGRQSGIAANISSDDNNNAIVVFGTPANMLSLKTPCVCSMCCHRRCSLKQRSPKLV